MHRASSWRVYRKTQTGMMISDKAFLPVRWIGNLAHGFFEADTPHGCKMQNRRGCFVTYICFKTSKRVSIGE